MTSPTTKPETLTDEERAQVELIGTNRERRYARIIDAHAADRAALVAQLEAARTELAALQTRTAAAVSVLEGGLQSRNYRAFAVRVLGALRGR